MSKEAFRVEEIVPDVSLFGKLGARSRAFPMVVTELVDNSLDSWIALPKSYKKDSLLEVEITARVGKDAWFVIKDNAGGMDQKGLIDALTVAKSNKDKDGRFIGHFGLGLKSAAMYIGSKFRVFTVHYENPKLVNFVEFDREKFEKSGEWKLKFEQMSASDAAKLDIVFSEGHGTEIQIRNERYSPGNKGPILNRLSRVFGPRLPKNTKLKIDVGPFEEEMIIKFNDEQVIAAGPFYEVWDNSIKQAEEKVSDFLKRLKKDNSLLSEVSSEDIKGKQEEAAIIPGKLEWFETIPGILKIPEKTINGKKVWGRIGILDRGMAHNNKYGFDLIKNGRIIEENVLDKDMKDREVGLMASNHNARIGGQLFLNDWTTDHQKTSFLKDSKDWLELVEYVREHSNKLLKISSLLQNPNKYFREHHNLVDEKAPEVIAERKFEEKIPEIEKFVQKAVRSSAVKETISKIEKDNIKKGENPKPPSKEKEPVESTSKLLFTRPIIKNNRKGENAPMVITKLTREKSGNVLEITLNRDHPFLASRESAELAVIGEFLAMDYFAGYILSNKFSMNHEDFVKLRDELLKELSLKK